MKWLLVVSLVVISLSSIRGDFYDNMIHTTNLEIQRKYEPILNTLYDKNQLIVIDETEKLLLEIKSFKWRWSRLWNKFCTKSKDFSFCKFVKGLVKTSKSGIEKLSNATEINHLEKIKKETREDFIKEFSEMLKKKLEENRSLIHKNKLGCYFTQMRKQMETHTKYIKTKTENDRKDHIAEFIERMESFREEVKEYKKSISENYRKCVKSQEVRHCLDSYVKVRNLSALF